MHGRFLIFSDCELTRYSSFGSSDHDDYVKVPIGRQAAEYDQPYCAPRSSKDQPNYTDRPSQFEHYRRISQSPRTPVE